jgi:hypothetical protein
MVGLEKLLKDLVGELTALRNAEKQLSRSTAIDHLNAKLKALSDDNPEIVRTACFFISVGGMGGGMAGHAGHGVRPSFKLT